MVWENSVASFTDLDYIATIIETASWPDATDGNYYQWKKGFRALDPYLSVLVDELLSLTEFPVYDSYCSAPVKVKVALKQYLCDILAHSKVMHLSGHNA